MKKVKLLVAPCSYEAAKYAVMHWHYSKTMPRFGLVKYGVWEDGHFVGVVIFGRGGNKGLLNPYGLKQTEGCELVRIALTKHQTQVSHIVSMTLKMIKRNNPKLRLIVSFADTSRNHHGGIYQAGNWIYNGKSQSADEYIYKGKQWHGRAFRSVYGSHKKYCDAIKIVGGAIKHRYLYPLDKKMRKQIESLKKEYPKRATSIDSDAPAVQAGEGGANPTVALKDKRIA
jgi:hypothetical protein